MINIKKNSLEMLRGKVVEDAIRQSFLELNLMILSLLKGMHMMILL